MTGPATKPTAGQRLEGVVLVLILLTVAAFAGAASFTHVHDWTMDNSPTGTGDWFGWANAVISELVPTASALVMRRRRRVGQPIGYPMFLMMCAVAVSLAAQLAVAKPGISGWLLSAVPALAFLGLTKLILSPATQPQPDTSTVDVPGLVPTPAHSVTAHGPATDVPAAGELPAHEPVVELIPGARIVADAYHKATGTHITREALAERLRVPVTTAARLLDALATSQPHHAVPVAARHNGAPVVGALT